MDDDKLEIDLKQIYKEFPKHIIWAVGFFILLLIVVLMPIQVNKFLHKERWQSYQNQTPENVIVDLHLMNLSAYNLDGVLTQGSCMEYDSVAKTTKLSFLCLREMSIEYINRGIVRSAVIMLFILLFFLPVTEYILSLRQFKDNDIVIGFVSNLYPVLKMIVLAQMMFIVLMAYVVT
jgi:hypothetical protein